MANSGNDAVESVTLKRNVTIKAVVTEDFKKFLGFELTQGIQNLEARNKQIDDVVGDAGTNAELKKQLETEKARNLMNIEDMRARQESAKNLELNSHFSQGIIEGFATVKKGDNLYQKLGAMEIVIKDGIVQDISIITAAPPAAPSA